MLPQTATYGYVLLYTVKYCCVMRYAIYCYSSIAIHLFICLSACSNRSNCDSKYHARF